MNRFYKSSNRRNLIKALKKTKFEIVHGSKHDLAICVTNGNKVTIPRHNTISPGVTKMVADLLTEKKADKQVLSKYIK